MQAMAGNVRKNKQATIGTPRSAGTNPADHWRGSSSTRQVAFVATTGIATTGTPTILISTEATGMASLLMIQADGFQPKMTTNPRPHRAKSRPATM